MPLAEIKVVAMEAALVGRCFYHVTLFTNKATRNKELCQALDFHVLKVTPKLKPRISSFSPNNF